MLKFEFLKENELEELRKSDLVEVYEPTFLREEIEYVYDYDSMNHEENLILNASMFVNGDMGANKFSSIKDFADIVEERTGYSCKKTLDKINEMLDKNILKTVNF